MYELRLHMHAPKPLKELHPRPNLIVDLVFKEESSPVQGSYELNCQLLLLAHAHKVFLSPGPVVYEQLILYMCKCLLEIATHQH